jgi:peptide-methionine (R)-S-oxide reductase
MRAKSNQSASGYDLTPLTEAERNVLAQSLTPEERHVILDHGTERPFCGALLNNKASGIYACRLCGLPLFRADNKFESGTGWPSFYEGFDAEHIRELRDASLGMIRVEIRCARCDGHLGHVFPDGPPPTHKRYCLNSASLQFHPDGQDPEQHVGKSA